ncbi:MAG TPA: hypothetical protein VJ103_01805 [Candidatus Paceibacterota bacterium]|nr:hypothetical protein [Candidatus Paceibacterota bacterium]
MSNKKLQLFINPKEVNLDPKLNVYQVEVVREPEREGDSGGVWTESFGSISELGNFLKGFRVACEMASVSFKPDYLHLTEGAINNGDFASKEEVEKE